MKDPLMVQASAVAAQPAYREWSAVLPYVVPIATFGLLSSVEHWLPLEAYPMAYGVKIAALIAIFVVYRSSLRDIRPEWRFVLPAVLVGLGAFVVWVGLESLVPYPRLGTRMGFDPFGGGAVDAGVVAFLIVRLFGLVLLVPVMEELFWRSFLLRYLTDHRFERVPIGTFSGSAVTLMVVASAVSHPEWLVAALTSLAYAYWLKRTASLFAVVVAHAVTNAALGAWVLATASWSYW